MGSQIYSSSSSSLNEMSLPSESSSPAETAPSSASTLDSLPETILSKSTSSLTNGVGNSVAGENEGVGSSAAKDVDVDVDPQIIEALRSKDRLYVLKLGEIMESLIKDGRMRADLTPATSYQRLLVHRCSAYYKLTPQTDPSSKGIFVHATIESRIPTRRICELVPAEQSAQPSFQIMRRSQQDRRTKNGRSHAGSANGDDGELSDVEPSESGSSTNRKSRMTIEEREAAYNEARSRIFMDFTSKEKQKDKDSASSSTLSLVSGSASTTSGRDGSSVGDADDSISTSATESEWSGSVTRENNGGSRKEGRKHRGTGPGSANSSSRSLRSGAVPFNSNGSGTSSRDSRSGSPVFTYPSLYEASSAPFPYDHNGQHPPPPHQNAAYPQPYYYWPPPAGGQPYPQPYYYGPYPGYPPPPSQPPQNHSDPASPHNGDGYPHGPQPYGYNGPYPWPQNPTSQPTPPVHSHSQPPPRPSLMSANSSSQNGNQYPPYMPPYGYPPMHAGYYPPQPPPMVSSPELNSNPYHGDDIPRGNWMGNGDRSRGLNQSGKQGSSMRTGAWSYGPGVSDTSGHVLYNPNSHSGESVGPRLTSSMRRPSGNSVGSRSTTGDEASSTASSSTTSSSSRRTYTSTTSSQPQHPLPARPDWAVGLKPQPTLASQVRHDHARGASPMTPPRNHNGNRSKSKTPDVLQSTDFPPLLPSGNEKRAAPVVAGAWTNAPSTRSIIKNANPAQQQPQPGFGETTKNAASSRGSSGENSADSADEVDGTFERPPPKSNLELYNPVSKPQRKQQANGAVKLQASDTVDQLTNRVQALSMETNTG